MASKIEGLYEAIAAILNVLEAEGESISLTTNNVYGIQGGSGRVRWDYDNYEWTSEGTY